MSTPNIKNILGKVLDKLPTPLLGLKNQLNEVFERVLTDVFKELKLVSREEFEVQAQVLARTREKVEALEAAVAALEGKKGTGSPPSSS
jgi:BMFP domain-containing protein YqiC